MRKKITVRKNADGTATLRIGSYVAHFSVEKQTVYETYEVIRWEAITAGVTLDDTTVTDLLRIARGLHE